LPPANHPEGSDTGGFSFHAAFIMERVFSGVLNADTGDQAFA
jgi:hypothetical protein